MPKNIDCDRILFSERTIQKKVRETASRLDKEYRGKTPLLLCILKGSIFFFSDLIRKMSIPIIIDFMRVSSYGNSTESGTLSIKQDLTFDPKGKDVLIVEDIVDSGRTLYFLKQYLLKKGAQSVKTVALLDKPVCRQVPFQPDYKCFDVENEFVVGYGMDYAERYRNLPYIAVVKREIYGNNL